MLNSSDRLAFSRKVSAGICEGGSSSSECFCCRIFEECFCLVQVGQRSWACFNPDKEDGAEEKKEEQEEEEGEEEEQEESSGKVHETPIKPAKSEGKNSHEQAEQRRVQQASTMGSAAARARL